MRMVTKATFNPSHMASKVMIVGDMFAPNRISSSKIKESFMSSLSFRCGDAPILLSIRNAVSGTA